MSSFVNKEFITILTATFLTKKLTRYDTFQLNGMDARAGHHSIGKTFPCQKNDIYLSSNHDETL